MQIIESVQVENIFHAFNLCPFDKIKVVILGQGSVSWRKSG